MSRHHERGVAIAEFAFVAPLLFVLLFGFLELGLLVVGSSVGTNAAREGARVGILRYLDADDVASASHAEIEEAVESRLAGLVNTADIEVDVRCLDYDAVRADAPDPSIDCDPSVVEPGRDLLEVAVTWHPIVLTGFVGPEERTDRARMTIVSRTPGGPSSTTSPDSSLPSLSLACTPTALTETNANQTATCTVTRSTMIGEPSVGFHVTDGTASSGSDFTAASGSILTFTPGSATTTFTVTIHGDTAHEPTEDFSISLVGPTAAVLGTPSSSTLSIANDDPADATAPTVQSARLEDSRVANGKVDTIRVTFDEALGSCSASGVSASGLPAGYSVASVERSGNSVVFNLAEGSAHVTSVGAIQVEHSGGLCDDAGNAVAPFTLVPTDAAAPYLVSIWSANAAGGTAHRPDAGDTVRLTFTEPMQAPTAGNVLLQKDQGNNKRTFLTVGPLTSALDLGDLGSAWFTGSGNPGGTSTWSTTTGTAGNDIVVTLGTCSGSCSLQAGPATVAIPGFAWATAPRDVAGNAAPHPIAPPASAIPFAGVSLF